MANPYLNQSPIHFWKTAVAGSDLHAVMPIRSRRFRIAEGASIATAGSCFAQEFGRFVPTMPGVTFAPAEPAAPGQPLFSALYGNIYTARQLTQLFDRAFGRFTPADSAWRRADGRYVDPFRPYVFASGFPDPARVAAAREGHFAAVRRVFTESSVFVFTLGLTECWRNIADGAVFPVAPGVVSDDIDPARYEFHNFTYAEVVDDMRGFAIRSRGVNPASRIILTVSPVPLIATFTRDHVLVASAHSKAILRAACAAVEDEFDFVYYFPSYEIISGHFTKGRYYDPNLRTVTREGVDHVMTLFRRTYLDPADDSSAAGTHPPDGEPDDEVICDEDEIVQSVGF